MTCSQKHPSFAVTRPENTPQVLVVCEHASRHIPAEYGQLGLAEEAINSHIAWDPGALPVAKQMAKMLGACLVSGTMSRLIYDCNRPPDAPSAIPIRSEAFDIPGNVGLTEAERAARIAQVYAPFSKALSNEIARHRDSLRLMVTIHSFTPVFDGITRDVEIGLVHGQDAGFAQAMMAMKPRNGRYCIRLNEPYAAIDGVAHTLDHQGAANRLANVMVEVRNDLIATETDQRAMAAFLTDWVKRTMDQVTGEEAAK